MLREDRAKEDLWKTCAEREDRAVLRERIEVRKTCAEREDRAKEDLC